MGSHGSLILSCTSSRTLASQVPLLPRMNRSGTRLQTSSPRQYLASSFGPLRRGSPRKRRTRHCCELCEHLFSGEGFSIFCSCSNEAMIWPHPAPFQGCLHLRRIRFTSKLVCLRISSLRAGVLLASLDSTIQLVVAPFFA